MKALVLEPAEEAVEHWLGTVQAVADAPGDRTGAPGIADSFPLLFSLLPSPRK